MDQHNYPSSIYITTRLFFFLRGHILDLSLVQYVKTLVSFVQMNNRLQEEEQFSANNSFDDWDSNFNVLK